MTMDFVDILIQNGAMGLFAAYLVYRDTKSEKRMDEMQNRFLLKIQELTRMNSQNEQEQLLKFEEREQKLRDKYDSVVGKLDEERKIITNSISTKLDQSTTKIENIADKLSTITTKFDDISSRITVLEQKVNQLDGQIAGIKLIVESRRQ
jgi:exonuclease VII large subunit